MSTRTLGYRDKQRATASLHFWRSLVNKPRATTSWECTSCCQGRRNWLTFSLSTCPTDLSLNQPMKRVWPICPGYKRECNSSRSWQRLDWKNLLLSWQNWDGQRTWPSKDERVSIHIPMHFSEGGRSVKWEGKMWMRGVVWDETARTHGWLLNMLLAYLLLPACMTWCLKSELLFHRLIVDGTVLQLVDCLVLYCWNGWTVGSCLDQLVILKQLSLNS